MPPRGIVFGRKAARDIVETVKRVKRMPRQSRAPGQPRKPSKNRRGFDRCTCLAKGAITGTGTKTVDNVEVISGVSPLDDPTDTAEELSVTNPHAFEVDDNGLMRIEWNLTDEEWQIYQATCPA